MYILKSETYSEIQKMVGVDKKKKLKTLLEDEKFLAANLTFNHTKRLMYET